MTMGCLRRSPSVAAAVLHHTDLRCFSVRELAAAARLAEYHELDAGDPSLRWLRTAATPLLNGAGRAEALVLRA